MTADDFMTNFIKVWTGKRDDFDGGYGVQCVDAAKRGMYILGIQDPPATGNGWAHGYWYNYNNISKLKNNFDKITGIENIRVGDMLLWDCPHVAWYAGSGKVFSQNQAGKNDGYSLVSFYAFKGYLGALRYKFFDKANPTPTPGAPSKSVKNYGHVTADILNVRVWAGTEYERFTQIYAGAKVGICDSRNDTKGKKWYYIKMTNGKYGFVHSDYIRED